MKYLHTQLQYLKGVGERRASFLRQLRCNKYIDLLLHIPTNYVDRRKISNIKTLISGDLATLPIEVISIQNSSNMRWHSNSSTPLKIQVLHEDTPLELVYFKGQQYVQKQFKVGAKMIVSGKVKIDFHRNLQIPHPDFAVPIDNKDNVLKIEPIYPLSMGLTSKYISEIIAKIIRNLDIYKDQLEWLPQEFLAKQNWPTWMQAITTLHQPQQIDSNAISAAKARLAFDEMLAHILKMRAVKKQYDNQEYNKDSINQSIELTDDSNKGASYLSCKLINSCLEILPFDLTGAQKRVLEEICNDLNFAHKMQRLIQGDVGSGKTIVAFLASLFMVERHGQVVLIAPTEVLAKQHYKNLKMLGDQLGVHIELLISAIPNTAKINIKQRLAGYVEDALVPQERVDIVIGTHAILQDDVEFQNLKLAIFDEQHKFGVAQRRSLLRRGNAVHYMMMSATPIPRTLALVSYADKDLSVLDEKPKNRKKINTISLSSSKLNTLTSKLAQFIERGEKVFWLCPLVEENEESDLTAVRARFENLCKLYPEKVGLVHGRMKPEQKDEMMRNLIDGSINILVATTVIEVGVDVGDATLMVIENCERYGLSQLHQLRGRIGRGKLDGTCILMHGQNIGAIARQRIRVMKESDDGFYIANQDLKLRGQGDLAGLKQSGVPDFRIFDVLEDDEVLNAALDFAASIESSGESENFTDMIALYKND